MTSEKQNEPNQQKIKVTKNGPYLVYGSLSITEQEITVNSEGIPIRWTQHFEHPKKVTCSICRCGQSKNKPFCDGTHARVGFNGNETANNEEYLAKPDIIDGPALKLMDIETLCASARFCHRNGGIWNLVPESDNIEAKKTACEETCDCPSGRLILQDKKTGKKIEPVFEPSLVLIEDPDMGVSGPLWVRGQLT